MRYFDVFFEMIVVDIWEVASLVDSPAFAAGVGGGGH